jgi:hypothetical protein
LDIAKVLLSKVMKTYPHALPVGAQRSSHWLALATPEVRQRLSDWSQEVASYLDREYAILWQESLVQEVGDLQLHSKFPELNDYYSGDEIFIPYIVNNRSQLPADQVSVFMRSSSPYIETKEVLIGRLESGQSRRGDMKFRIPVYVTPGDYSLEMGLGSKGDIVSRDLLVYKFRVEEGARPKVVVTATISDNHRGKMDGVLEANESALLEVKLTNESHLAIRDLRVGIVNLSGRQILAQKTTELIDHLNAWEEKIVYLKVSGSSHIVSDTLQLGVLVDSQDIGLPIRHQVNLKGWPSRMALDLKATGH